LHHHLSIQHAVFIDQTMAVGTPWAERIDSELKRSDFLLMLLSAASVTSEMVVVEVQTAQRLHREHSRPRILPVWLASPQSFPYPLSAYLNPLQWARWNSPAATPRMLAELERARSWR